MIGPFSQYVAGLRWLLNACCGKDNAKYLLSPVDGGVALESTPLLRDDDGGGPLDAPGVIVLPPSESPTHPDEGHAPHLMLVMRHAHRADEDDEEWTQTAARPWDPPLSQLGHVQAQEAAQNLLALQPSLQIEYIISSPFLRCLQTSAEAVKALDLPQGRWLVDWSMGEIAEPRLLLGGRPELEDKMEGRALETWMWSGASSRDALANWVQSEAKISGVQQRPVLLPRPVPPYPEMREAAMGRYEQELGYLAQGAKGMLQGNCLVVTHGEAVRCSVNLMEPDATVYEVKHCSHVKLRRPVTDPGAEEEAAGGGQGPLSQVQLSALGWQLACKSGETGVSWFV